MADLPFHCLEFDQTSKSVANLTKAKQLNPNSGHGRRLTIARLWVWISLSGSLIWRFCHLFSFTIINLKYNPSRKDQRRKYRQCLIFSSKPKIPPPYALSLSIPPLAFFLSHASTMSVSHWRCKRKNLKQRRRRRHSPVNFLCARDIFWWMTRPHPPATSWRSLRPVWPDG